ncbi:MAG: anti-sigma factor [Nocardioides sp.]|nr:anti-sigma factor [Nocardioides sp.]
MSDIHALSGAYAVDALDDLERASFERHLAGCATCRSEVDGLRETSSLLGGACSTTAPDGLRERVLAEIALSRPLPPPGGVTTLQRRDRHRRGPRRAVAALAAAAAAVIAIGGGTVLVTQLGDDPVRTVQLSATDRVLQAPDAEEFTTPTRDGLGTVTVVRSSSLNQAVLITKGLAEAPAGKTRELWLKHDNTYIPAGFLGGGTDHTMLLDGDPGSAQGFGLTIEPASGSTQPSDQLVALLNFTSA